MRFRRRIRSRLVVFAILACGISQPAGAQARYTVTDLGTLPSFDSSEANGINASGLVSGTSTDTVGGVDHAFVWSSGGGMLDLGTLGFQSSEAIGINATAQLSGSLFTCGVSTCLFHAFLWTSNAGLTDIHTSTDFASSLAARINTTGWIVGMLANNTPPAHAFLWRSDTGLMDLGPMPGLTSSSAAGINDAGQIVGGSWDDVTGMTRAFLWTSGAGFTDLGTLAGFTDAEATAINAAGQVVGEASTGSIGPVHGFLWMSDGTMTDLGTLPGFASVHPHAINAGVVVTGEASNDPAPGRAFIWQNNVITDLNTLIPPESGWLLQRATGINDSGQIVGTGVVGGQTHAFLLTPIP
jgi:probable HAF family extracellular repeat protein